MDETRRFGYNGYVIEPRSYEVLNRATREPAGWVPHALLYRDQGGTFEIQPLSLPSQIMESEATADRIAVQMACRWIDDKG